MHNLCKYILKKGRWREFGIMQFYLYAVLIVILRLIALIGYLISYQTRVDGIIIEQKPSTGFEVGNSCWFII
jgi:hypothetical protein